MYNVVSAGVRIARRACGTPARARWTVVLALGLAAAAGVACSPTYVARAGLAEAEILGARRPLADVVLDPDTDPRTRGMLTFVMEAREFAIHELGLNAGESYTSFVQLDSDTLALVLSAAYRDRLTPRTWWFPVVGHVPYRGFFSEEEARREQEKLEAEGFDTYLRPTSAFSTLGWFDDPLLSSVLGIDEIEAVNTVIHEMAHEHLFVPSRVRFNESYANTVGRMGAAQFFCTRPGGGQDTVKCQRAQARWRDTVRYSAFLDEFLGELDALYADSTRTSEEKIRDREGVFEAAQERYRSELRPSLESLTFGSFARVPLNNATVLARLRYYHRLPDFQRFVEEQGGLKAALVTFAARAGDTDDPFDVLSVSSTGSPPAP